MTVHLFSSQSFDDIMQENARLTVRNAELVEVVNDLLACHDEWVGDMHYDVLWCPYCRKDKTDGHKPDCPRQRAAALVEEVRK